MRLPVAATQSCKIYIERTGNPFTERSSTLLHWSVCMSLAIVCMYEHSSCPEKLCHMGKGRVSHGFSALPISSTYPAKKLHRFFETSFDIERLDIASTFGLLAIDNVAREKTTRLAIGTIRMARLVLMKKLNLQVILSMHLWISKVLANVGQQDLDLLRLPAQKLGIQTQRERFETFLDLDKVPAANVFLLYVSHNVLNEAVAPYQVFVSRPWPNWNAILLHRYILISCVFHPSFQLRAWAWIPPKIPRGFE